MGAPSIPLSIRETKEGLDQVEEAVTVLQTPGGVRTVTAATGSLSATDAGGVVIVDRGTGVTITVPEGALAAGAKPTKIVQKGAGAVTIDPTGAVNLNWATSDIVTAGANTVVTITPLANNLGLVEVNAP